MTILWRILFTTFISVSIMGGVNSAGGQSTVNLPPTNTMIIEAVPEALSKIEDSGTSVDQAMNTGIEVIRERLKLSGLDHIKVTLAGQSTIKLEFLTAEDIEPVRTLVMGKGTLEIRLTDDDADPANIDTGKASPGNQVLPMADGSGSIEVKRHGWLVGNHITYANHIFDIYTEEAAVQISFDEVGKKRLSELTSKNVGSMIAIILDGEVLTTPVIREPILDGVVLVSGNFTPQEAKDLALQLRTGHAITGFRILAITAAE